MATAAAIAAVELQLPDEAGGLGFTPEAIGQLLDSGLTQTKTILAALRGMAAKASSIEDISESGSSRSSRFFDNLKSLTDYWQGQSDKEDQAGGSFIKESARIHTAVRV